MNDIPVTLSRHLTHDDCRRLGRAVADLVWMRASTMTDDDRARARQIRAEWEKASRSGATQVPDTPAV